MKMIAIVLAAVAMAACDRTTNSNGTLIAFAPTLAIEAQITPQTLPLFVATTPCTSGTAFSTRFDLVIAQTGPNVFIDQVVLRLIDGTDLGGPSITIPQLQLMSMFGSTRVMGSRAFSFQPQFGCGLTRPGSIAGKVVLTDATAIVHTVSVNAAFR